MLESDLIHGSTKTGAVSVGQNFSVELGVSSDRVWDFVAELKSEGEEAVIVTE